MATRTLYGPFQPAWGPLLVGLLLFPLAVAHSADVLGDLGLSRNGLASLSPDSNDPYVVRSPLRQGAGLGLGVVALGLMALGLWRARPAVVVVEPERERLRLQRLGQPERTLSLGGTTDLTLVRDPSGAASVALSHQGSAQALLEPSVGEDAHLRLLRTLQTTLGLKAQVPPAPRLGSATGAPCGDSAPVAGAIASAET